MQVRGPDGATWRIRRHWLPRHRHRGFAARWARRKKFDLDRAFEGDRPHVLDFLDLPVESPTGCLVMVLVVVFVVVFVVYGVPLLLAVVDVVVLLVLAVAGVVGRVLFGRPWTVEAQAPGRRRHEERVVGWRASGERMRLLAGEVRVSGRPGGA